MLVNILLIINLLYYPVEFPEFITKGDLVVEIQNTKDIKGDILISLYNSPDGFPEAGANTFKNKKISVAGNGKVQVIFEDIPHDTYAFALMLDEDADEKMDKNFLGIPVEGFAFSNNVKPKLSTPDFEECSFKVNSGRKYMLVKLLYY